MAKSPKVFDCVCQEDRIPLSISRASAASALVVGALESSCDNVTILDRVVVALLRSSPRLLNVRVAASHIENRSRSRAELSAEIDESVQMNSSILVQLSANDALSSMLSKQFHNSPRIQVSALGIGDEGISAALDDEWSQSEVTWLSRRPFCKLIL